MTFIHSIFNNLISVADINNPYFGQNLDKYKIAINLFDRIPIQWYAIMILMAVVLSVVIGYFGYAKRLGITSDHLFEGVLICVVAGIIGARLWFVVANILEEKTASEFVNQNYIPNLKAIIGITENGLALEGLAISGGVIFAGIALAIFCKYRKIKTLYLFEIVLPLIMISQVLGRWGNFFNFEAHGGFIFVEGMENLDIAKSISENVIGSSERALPLEILDKQRDFLWFFPDVMKDRMFIEYEGIWGYCHPCFFYEGLANFLGFTGYMLLRRFVKKGIYVGDGLSFYLIWYGTVRFFIEMLRTDAQMINGTGIKVVMVYTPIMIILGIVWLIVRRVKKIQLITCYDALYGMDSTILLNPNESKNKKNKKKEKEVIIVTDEDNKNEE